MALSEPVRHVRPQDRVEADPTPNMVRELAFQTGGLWAGLVKTHPRATSGWHHHGEHETCIYVVSGELVMESGPGGSEQVHAVAGDFLQVPARAVHRESNPGEELSEIVVVRSGKGPTTVNVEGPA